MSRRKSAKAESPVLTNDATLKGPLTQPNHQATLHTLRNMFEFAQSFQMIHLFKRALQVSEPVEIEVLEEELVTCSDMGRLTRQITWALVRANMRIKKKHVDDVELWAMAKRVWEGHREEWEDEADDALAESAEGVAESVAESVVESVVESAVEAENESTINGNDQNSSSDHTRDQSHDLKRSPSPLPSPPAKRTRSTRSAAKAEAAKLEEEESKSRGSSRGRKVKKEEPATPEIDESAAELAAEEEEAAAAALSRDLEQRNRAHRLVLPDLDYNPFAESSTLVSSFSRFTPFQLVKIWYQLIQWIFDHEDKSRDLVETTLRLTDYKAEELRSEPIGWDSENHVFYLFGDSRLYKREERTNQSGFDVLDLDIDTWSCVCATWQDWEAFMEGLESRDREYKRVTKQGQPKSKSRAKKPAVVDESLKYDSELFAFFSRDVLPVVSEVFLEKARASLSRDKERQLEAAMATRKTSSRIQALQAKKEEQEKVERKEAESRAAQKMERKRLERIELQRKQMEERQMARERRFERRVGAKAELAASGNDADAAGGVDADSAVSVDADSARRRPPRRAAATAPVTWTFDCICGVHGENYEDDKAMIECETCKTWMHIECLRDRRNVDTESFECDVCGSREEREARARERQRIEEEKAEKKRKVEEEKARVEEEKARLKKEKNALRWQERKKRMKARAEEEAREKALAESGVEQTTGSSAAAVPTSQNANSATHSGPPLQNADSSPPQSRAPPLGHFPPPPQGNFPQGHYQQQQPYQVSQQFHQPQQQHYHPISQHQHQQHQVSQQQFHGQQFGQQHQGHFNGLPPMGGFGPGQFGASHVTHSGHMTSPGHNSSHVNSPSHMTNPGPPQNAHSPAPPTPVTPSQGHPGNVSPVAAVTHPGHVSNAQGHGGVPQAAHVTAPIPAGDVTGPPPSAGQSGDQENPEKTANGHV